MIVWAYCTEWYYPEQICKIVLRTSNLSDPPDRACFKTYGFRMRVKADTYNDETRMKHSVVDASDLEYASYCKRLIQVQFGL